MARTRGLERINRDAKHNKLILKSVFDIEPKRGKMSPIMVSINETYKEILKNETAAKFTVYDFFDKSPEVIGFISGKIEFLESNIKSRGYDINIGKEGFDNYEGLHISFLKEHKAHMIAKLTSLELI